MWLPGAAAASSATSRPCSGLIQKVASSRVRATAPAAIAARPTPPTMCSCARASPCCSWPRLEACVWWPRGGDDGRHEGNSQRVRFWRGTRRHAPLRRCECPFRSFVRGARGQGFGGCELRRVGRQGSADSVARRSHLPCLLQHQADYILRGAAFVRGRSLPARRSDRKIYSPACEPPRSAPGREFAKRYRASRKTDHHSPSAEPPCGVELRFS